MVVVMMVSLALTPDTDLTVTRAGRPLVLSWGRRRVTVFHSGHTLHPYLHHSSLSLTTVTVSWDHATLQRFDHNKQSLHTKLLTEHTLPQPPVYALVTDRLMLMASGGE